MTSPYFPCHNTPVEASSRTSQRVRDQLDPEALRHHAQRRIAERYGLALHPEEIRDLERRIRLGQSLRVCRQYWARSVHHIVYRDTVLYVVFDDYLNCLCTALDLDFSVVRAHRKKIGVIS